MTRYIRQWLACRRLSKLVAKQREKYETKDYAKRRAAMLKHTRPQLSGEC